MKPGEIVNVQHDKTRGMPREGSARRSGQTHVSRPALWAAKPAVDFEPPGAFWGAYPKGFLAWAARAMNCARADVVHFCSGSLPDGEGLRIDIRPEMRPDIIADCRAVPLRDASAAAVLIDPPYSVEYAQDLYETEYPRPSALLAEASRIARPGAPIGILHFLVVMPPAGTTIEAVYGVTTGPNYRIRAFTVFRKCQAQLFEGDHDA